MRKNPEKEIQKETYIEMKISEYCMGKEIITNEKETEITIDSEKWR